MAKDGYIRFDDERDPEEEKKEAAPPPFAAVQQNLFKARTVLIFGQIDMKLAQGVTAQLLALSQEGDDPIRVVVNSPGGHVEAGDTIHDMIRFVKPEVKMLGTGWVASAGCHIFLAAKKENRFCLPNTRFLIHQPLGGTGGRATDIAIEAKEIIRMRERLNKIIARETGQPEEKVAKDTDRNYWMMADEARAYGIVSHIIETSEELR
ncbi:ATP-dependent Clp protease proteolytic subunit [Azospirillum sp. RWY-5-1]|uniref:ATP-dependent Clp protease proteolytic subunit n=1 Tax=Azospirillum oleiclasticum TaxID=2735135 RepID=A0ABX2T676_9PROT|nr:ATP-dependent Clp protease proteolytic subunit [Azospirillum oleiclasticum]NYZ10993.1 ATP-dependent Clp protease proteolytic subunit [Azospirillum oleiclasticum]NYZ18155.1 ATP-dependent Clp protease proteolytic subunit [Azospirillum oleiclasticum]